MTTSSTPSGAGSRDRFHDDLMAEYCRLADTVAAFDQRLLTIKSWGVTFSFATLALGFQQNHYGLFLAAAAGALGFWFIEVSTKVHQMRYYPRMGDIEALAYELFGEKTAGGLASSPLIDWAWSSAAQRIWGVDPKRNRTAVLLSLKPTRIRQKEPQVPKRWDVVNGDPGVMNYILLWPPIALPHAIAVVLGLVLFALGLFGVFGSI
ncbi:hypothetical protein EV646_109374 [Kribbella antiqua]|uniref:Uncharacterized protein n=1 Tax=Kribbella antiqua TaxID=2512217 RepID=A0A4R2IMK2_9ACTN|nr:hypothetical protein [Kribbella antiqua]TCO45199.1 hypothetical protein EV646_109374 [Kribbella antiqua]